MSARTPAASAGVAERISTDDTDDMERRLVAIRARIKTVHFRMPLRESFESSGNWLFRWRSYLPVALFLIVLLAMTDFSYPRGSESLDQLWECLCLAVALAGLVIRSLVVGRAPAGTSGRNTGHQIANVLNTTGWYSVVRHPLYLGNYFMWLGVAMFPRRVWVVVVISMAFWLYYERIMYAEEEFLRRQFGATFEEWASRTPAFIPAFRQWVPSSMPFSWRIVLRREYSGLYGVIASLALLETVGDAVVTGHWIFDRMWVVVFVGTTVLYLGLMALKRRTGMLSVAGR